MNFDRLFELLTAYHDPGSFNQYRDVHPELDLPRGAVVRRHNLRCYLEAFAGARFVLVGEAAGYAGCRFSGIPFTCEAQFALLVSIGAALCCRARGPAGVGGHRRAGSLHPAPIPRGQAQVFGRSGCTENVSLKGLNRAVLLVQENG